MNVHHTLICCFFLMLQDRNSGAEILVKTGSYGGNITVICIFNFSGRTKSFCKDRCQKKEDILIKTDEVTAQSGRYKIAYREGTFPASYTHLEVSIIKLTESDTGHYRCGLNRSFSLLSSYWDIEITVEGAPTISGPKWTPRTFSTSVPSASSLNTTSISATSGSSRPSLASTPSLVSIPSSASTPSSSSGAGVELFVALTLVVMIILLSIAVLIFCMKRTRKPREPPVETDYVNVTEASPVYEEIREEGRWSRSPPVEISTVYALAKYTQPKGVRASDEYSLITTASYQRTAEDASSSLCYSEVDFSGGKAASLHAASCGDTDNDGSPFLYSTVTHHQL